jgi:hypothetical protein
MTKASLTIAACATLLWAGTALATPPTAQELCDNARITAWKVYTSCIDSVVAKEAKGVLFDQFAAFAKCRYAYFKKWTTTFQATKFVGSTCGAGDRFTDNGTTVTDNLTKLVWEKKTQDLSVHDEGNTYSWSTGSSENGNGTAFTTFLAGYGTGLNIAGFAGTYDWRLPTLAELQTIVNGFSCTGPGMGHTCSCGFVPCINLDFSPTQSNYYWSATTYQHVSTGAWVVGFELGDVGPAAKAETVYVRAVRGGL